MEAKNRDLERRLREEQALRQSAQAKLKELRKRDGTIAQSATKSEDDLASLPTRISKVSPEKERPMTASDSKEPSTANAARRPAAVPTTGGKEGDVNKVKPVNTPAATEANILEKKTTDLEAGMKKPVDATKGASKIVESNLPEKNVIGLDAGMKKPVVESSAPEKKLTGREIGTKKSIDSNNGASKFIHGDSTKGMQSNKAVLSNSNSPIRPNQQAPALMRDDPAKTMRSQLNKPSNDTNGRKSEASTQSLPAKVPSAIEFDPLRATQSLVSEDIDAGQSTPVDCQSVASTNNSAFPNNESNLGNAPVQAHFQQQFTAPMAIPIMRLTPAQGITNLQQAGSYQQVPTMMASTQQLTNIPDVRQAYSMPDQQIPQNGANMTNLSVFQQPFLQLSDQQSLQSMAAEPDQPMLVFQSPHVHGITMHDFSTEGILAVNQLQPGTDILQDAQIPQRSPGPHHTRSHSTHSMPNPTWNQQQPVTNNNQWMNQSMSNQAMGNNSNQKPQSQPNMSNQAMGSNPNQQPQSQHSLASDPFDELVTRRQTIPSSGKQ